MVQVCPSFFCRVIQIDNFVLDDKLKRILMKFSLIISKVVVQVSAVIRHTQRRRVIYEKVRYFSHVFFGWKCWNCAKTSSRVRRLFPLIGSALRCSAKENIGSAAAEICFGLRLRIPGNFLFICLQISTAKTAQHIGSDFPFFFSRNFTSFELWTGCNQEPEECCLRRHVLVTGCGCLRGGGGCDIICLFGVASDVRPTILFSIHVQRVFPWNNKVELS